MRKSAAPEEELICVMERRRVWTLDLRMYGRKEDVGGDNYRNQLWKVAAASIPAVVKYEINQSKLKKIKVQTND